VLFISNQEFFFAAKLSKYFIGVVDQRYQLIFFIISNVTITHHAISKLISPTANCDITE